MVIEAEAGLRAGTVDRFPHHFLEVAPSQAVPPLVGATREDAVFLHALALVDHVLDSSTVFEYREAMEARLEQFDMLLQVWRMLASNAHVPGHDGSDALLAQVDVWGGDGRVAQVESGMALMRRSLKVLKRFNNGPPVDSPARQEDERLAREWRGYFAGCMWSIVAIGCISNGKPVEVPVVEQVFADLITFGRLAARNTLLAFELRHPSAESQGA